MSSVINFYPFKLELLISRSSTVVYKYSDIMYIKFDKPYSVFYLMDCERKKRYSVSVSMAKIERNLPRILFRCNPTTIINYCYIKEYLIHKTGIKNNKLVTEKQIKKVIDRLINERIVYRSNINGELISIINI